MNDGWRVKDVALGSGVGLSRGRVQREKGLEVVDENNYNREFWSIELKKIEKIGLL